VTSRKPAPRNRLFWGFAGLLVATWIVGAGRILTSVNEGNARGDHSAADRAVQAVVVTAIILVSMRLAAAVSALPTGLRVRALRMRSTNSVVCAGLSSQALRSALAVHRVRPELPGSLFYLFPMAVDDRGVTFWRGLIRPEEFAVVPWDAVRTVSAEQVQQGIASTSMITFAFMDESLEPLRFVVAGDRALGIFARGRSSTNSLAQTLDDIRIHSSSPR
jgi:hypothetical protein